MAFETITPGGNPSPTPSPEPKAPEASPAAKIGSISEAEALKGAAHTKSGIFSVNDVSKGGASPIGQPGSSLAAGQLVTGKVAVKMMDAVLPAIFVVAFAKLGITVKKTALQLTQAEENTLVPVVQDCLNTINMNFSNPWQALAVTLLFIYGGKAIEVGGVSFLEKKAAASVPADPLKHERKKDATEATPASDVVRQSIPIAGSGVAGVQQNPMPNAPDFSLDGPTTWTEADVTVIEKKRKKGRKDAIAWLNKNWQKKGGILR